MCDGGVVVVVFEILFDVMFCSNWCCDFVYVSCFLYKWIIILRKKVLYKYRYRVFIVYLLFLFLMWCFVFGKVIYFCCSGNSGECMMMFVLDED